MKRQFSGLAVPAILVLAGLLATPAHATLGTLWVNIGGTNSGTTITGGTFCQDNDAACDRDPTLGVVTTLAVGLGTVTVTGSTSTSGSPKGTMSLSLNATPTTTGTFNVSVSDRLFNSPPPPLVLKQSFGGGSLGGTTASLGAVGYFGSTDVLFDTSATATATPSANTMLNAGTANTQTGKILSGNPYSLTDYLTINVTAVDSGDSKNFQLTANLGTSAIPEPASIVLLGSLLLLGVSLVRRKVGHA